MGHQAPFHSKDSLGTRTFGCLMYIHSSFYFVLVSQRFLCVVCFFCTVKFSIKSFRVPELYIDVPETATVGSLKVLKRQVFSFQFGNHILLNKRIVILSRMHIAMTKTLLFFLLRLSNCFAQPYI